MKHKFGVVCLCLSSLMTFNALANDSATVLKEKLSKVPSLKANFTQVVTDINHREIQRAKGVLALETPNKLYWHLTSPDESLIVADGKDVWLYNPFAEEVTAMDMKDVISASPIALLVHHDAKTWKDYKVTQNSNCFSIKPKAVDSTVTDVGLCFTNNTLSTLNIQDNQGNLSKFALKGQHSLTAKDEGLFKFTVPDGVDIDDQRATN